MSFSKKTTSSPPSDDSNTTKEDQQPQPPPHHHHRNIPSGLSIFSNIINIQPPSPPNILESISIKPSTITSTNTTEYSGNTPTPLRNVDGDRTGLFRIGSGGRKGKYEMCTECLGFESLAEKMDGSDDLNLESLLMHSPSRSRSRSRMIVCGAVREKTNLNDFPPLLSTLDMSGRPRFEFRKVSSNGRLQIDMVKNDKPGVVRTRGRDGEVRMEMVKVDDQQQQQQQDEEVEKKEGF